MNKEVEKHITKDMIIAEIVRDYPEVVEVFMEFGIHCFSCGAAQFETLEQGVMAHGIEVDEILEDLNFIINNP